MNSIRITNSRDITLTQLLVLVVGQDEDDVRPDVAAVSLEAGLQTLAREEVGGAERHRDAQEEEESARHGLRPLTSPNVQPISCFPRGVSASGRQTDDADVSSQAAHCKKLVLGTDCFEDM